MIDTTVFRHLLEVMPLHAEEGEIREEFSESELWLGLQELGSDTVSSSLTVAVVRRLFESLVLLDLEALARGRWTFVSFPASLMARSILETLGTPGSTFFEPDYWAQGRHRPDEIAEEQRALLHRLEMQRTSRPGDKVKPARTVHVAWGIIRLGNSYLLRRREDKRRTEVSGYVFPGGRLNLFDLRIEDQAGGSLRDLFCIDSALAREALQNTLARELREELGLFPNDFKATHCRTLEPYCKVEGTLNSHAYTQYDIAVYSILLSQDGEMRVLERAALEPDEWAWFSAVNLIAGRRADGRRPFVDALHQDTTISTSDLLSVVIPDSSSSRPNFQTRADAIALPQTSGDPILVGDAGKQKKVQLSLDKPAWELLMILGWHAKGLEIKSLNDSFVSLGHGWVKLLDEDLLHVATSLSQRLQDFGRPLVECDSFGHCRLSVSAEHLHFQAGCFTYRWDVESEEKPIVLRLKGISTKWATLPDYEVSVPLSPMLVKAMPALEAGREPSVDPETVRREFRRVFEVAAPIGLRQFLAWRNETHEILVPGET